jgi:hypothetical protein
VHRDWAGETVVRPTRGGAGRRRRGKEVAWLGRRGAGTGKNSGTGCLSQFGGLVVARKTHTRGVLTTGHIHGSVLVQDCVFTIHKLFICIRGVAEITMTSYGRKLNSLANNI